MTAQKAWGHGRELLCRSTHLYGNRAARGHLLSTHRFTGRPKIIPGQCCYLLDLPEICGGVGCPASTRREGARESRKHDAWPLPGRSWRFPQELPLPASGLAQPGAPLAVVTTSGVIEAVVREDWGRLSPRWFRCLFLFLSG